MSNNTHHSLQRVIRVGIIGAFFLLCLMPRSTDAAIQLVGTTTASGANAAYNLSLTSLQGGIAASAAQDDLVIVVNAFNSTANGNPGVGTAGFTELNDMYANDNYDINFSVSYKKMSSSPDTTVSCNPSSGAASSSVCLAYVWRGVDTTTPFDVASTSITGISAEDINCPSITPTTAGAVVLCTGGAVGSARPATITWPTTPAGIGGRTATSTDPGGAAIVVGTYGAWSSGAYDPAAFAMLMGTQAQNSWAALTMALRPAPSIQVLTTDAVSGVSVSGATLNATITNYGLSNATESGFAYGTDATLQTVIGTTTLGAQTGNTSFSGAVSSLLEGVVYYYRAYTTNAVGTGYGSISSFSTTNVARRTIRLFGGNTIKVIGNRIYIRQQ